MSEFNKSVSLHLITNCNNLSDKYLAFIESCASSGINYLQLRQKNWSFHELVSFGRELQHILSPFQIPLIINDNIKLVLKLNAAGVHLGQSDCNVKLARQMLGDEKIIGLTVETWGELKIANSCKEIDYVAASSVFLSVSKTNLRTIWGINNLKDFVKLSKHPVIAIGGINKENLCDVLHTGINGFAIINAIHAASSAALYIQDLLQIVGSQYL